MKKRFTVIGATLALALATASLATTPGVAQKGQKGKAAPPTGPRVHYFDLSSSIFSEHSSEAILKETRQGNTVVAAELDVCHLTDTNSLDRFVVPLKLEGSRLIGGAESQEGKQAVSVNLVRRSLANGNFTFEGTIRSGKLTEKIQSTDNAETSEEEIRDQYLTDTTIEEKPDDFTTAWPQTLLVSVNRTALSTLLEALRDQNVRVVFNGLTPSCRVLRSGDHTVQIDIDPERIGALVGKLKPMAGVVAIGFGSSGPNMQRAIRFPSKEWRDDGGKLDRDKLAGAVAAAMAKSLEATLISTSWDNRLGTLTIEMKRPEVRVAGLKLSELLTATVLVAPESPSSNQRSIAWIETVSGRVVEERDGEKLEFLVAAAEGDDESQSSNEPDGSDDLADAVATALKGVTWDSENERWSQ